MNTDVDEKRATGRPQFGKTPGSSTTGANQEEIMKKVEAAATPGPETTSGLVAYLDGEPIGWCAVEPRPAYIGLVRNNRVPWEGRDEDKADESVWA